MVKESSRYIENCLDCIDGIQGSKGSISNAILAGAVRWSAAEGFETAYACPPHGDIDSLFRTKWDERYAG